jgi:hypothetical protein
MYCYTIVLFESFLEISNSIILEQHFDFVILRVQYANARIIGERAVNTIFTICSAFDVFSHILL